MFKKFNIISLVLSLSILSFVSAGQAGMWGSVTKFGKKSWAHKKQWVSPKGTAVTLSIQQPKKPSRVPKGFFPSTHKFEGGSTPISKAIKDVVTKKTAHFKQPKKPFVRISRKAELRAQIQTIKALAKAEATKKQRVPEYNKNFEDVTFTEADFKKRKNSVVNQKSGGLKGNVINDAKQLMQSMIDSAKKAEAEAKKKAPLPSTNVKRVSSKGGQGRGILIDDEKSNGKPKHNQEALARIAGLPDISNAVALATGRLYHAETGSFEDLPFQTQQRAMDELRGLVNHSNNPHAKLYEKRTLEQMLANMGEDVKRGEKTLQPGVCNSQMCPDFATVQNLGVGALRDRLILMTQAKQRLAELNTDREVAELEGQLRKMEEGMNMPHDMLQSLDYWLQGGQSTTDVNSLFPERKQ